MSHKLIKGNNQIYLKLYGNVDTNDVIKSNILQIFDKNYSKLILDITNVLCYNEFVEGFKELFIQHDLKNHNAIIKERINVR